MAYSVAWIAGGLAGSPYILSNAGVPPTNIFTGAISAGWYINVANITQATITAVGRLCFAGDNQTHNIKIYDENSNVLSSTNVDMSLGTAGSYLYVAITPVVIFGLRRYWIMCEEFNGGDQYYNGFSGNTPTVDGSVLGSDIVAGYYDGTLHGLSSGKSYSGPNILWTSP